MHEVQDSGDCGRGKLSRQEGGGTVSKGQRRQAWLEQEGVGKWETPHRVLSPIANVVARIQAEISITLGDNIFAFPVVIGLMVGDTSV